MTCSSKDYDILLIVLQDALRPALLHVAASPVRVCFLRCCPITNQAGVWFSYPPQIAKNLFEQALEKGLKTAPDPRLSVVHQTSPRKSLLAAQ